MNHRSLRFVRLAPALVPLLLVVLGAPIGCAADGEDETSGGLLEEYDWGNQQDMEDVRQTRPREAR